MIVFLLFFILSDYSMFSIGFMVVWWLLVLCLQSFLLRGSVWMSIIMLLLFAAAPTLIVSDCHVVPACSSFHIDSVGSIITTTMEMENGQLPLNHCVCGGGEGNGHDQEEESSPIV